ncbi:MAG: LysR family transcriptional regulator [Rhodoferax sp.]|nr:LysR family transcriptional regulator [Rhodoferax sp.]MBP9929164.1 LysR family transcriptional regulator [Rhodoferax sp.]HQX58962.1 LysR family transcriptional regulator [Burkholderiaceae bacterium]HQZ05786.1 LysR family transcriptional regulator [Burkholderiaceae bacterium]HRA62063.1 LysR family transcriptional regulator [Burkholderiaceae bacterium]
MARLNFHHLHYFWAVAKEGNLTRAATQLHVSQSALSAQIRQLEAQLGQPLFARVGRGLQLTEAGQLAMGYADSIFAAGAELTALLREGRRDERQVLRIGAVATLSRNFQENFLRPLLERADVELVLQSGNLVDLLARLRVHTLDLILSNQRVHASTDNPWRCRRIARQPVSLVGRPRSKRQAFRFPDELAEVPLLLPGRDNDIRAAFDLMCERLAIRYRLRAEVDDMALLRLLARDSDSVALLPTVVVQDELRSGRLAGYVIVPDLYENFYAISVQRQFSSPLLKALLRQSEADVLGSLPA